MEILAAIHYHYYEVDSYVYMFRAKFLFGFLTFFQNDSSMGHYKDFHGEVSTICCPQKYASTYTYWNNKK